MIKNQLEDLLKDTEIREYPVVDFIDMVWGYRKSSLTIPDGGFTLNKVVVDEYIRRKYNRRRLPASAKRTAYEPLVELFQDVVRQLADAGNHLTANVSVVNMRNPHVQGHFTNFHPDFIWSWSPETPAQSWMLSALSGALAKTVTAEVEYRENIDMTLLPEVCPAYVLMVQSGIMEFD